MTNYYRCNYSSFARQANPIVWTGGSNPVKAYLLQTKPGDRQDVHPLFADNLATRITRGRVTSFSTFRGQIAQPPSEMLSILSNGRVYGYVDSGWHFSFRPESYTPSISGTDSSTPIRKAVNHQERTCVRIG
jgi:hypothetical protein